MGEGCAGLKKRVSKTRLSRLSSHPGGKDSTSSGNKNRAKRRSLTGYTSGTLASSTEIAQGNFYFFMNKSFVVSGLVAAFASAGSAHAAPTTFFFDSDDKGQTSLSKVVDGIKLTLSTFSAGPRSGADSDGIAVYCTSPTTPWTICRHDNFSAYEPYTSYQMTFDQQVKVLNYNVTYLNLASDSNTTYSQGALVSVQPNISLGKNSFVNQFIAAANIPILVSTADLDGGGLMQIDALTVEKQTPPPASVPGPLPLAGAAMTFSLSRELRRRLRRAVGA